MFWVFPKAFLQKLVQVTSLTVLLNLSQAWNISHFRRGAILKESCWINKYSWQAWSRISFIPFSCCVILKVQKPSEVKDKKCKNSCQLFTIDNFWHVQVKPNLMSNVWYIWMPPSPFYSYNRKTANLPNFLHSNSANPEPICSVGVRKHILAFLFLSVPFPHTRSLLCFSLYKI